MLHVINRAAWSKPIVRIATTALIAILLSGCDAVLLDPKGPVGEAERDIILLATGLMLIVVVPVIIMALVFAWRYRASNTKAVYAPEWKHSTAIEIVVWTIPVIIILILGSVTWASTHALDPRKPIASAGRPLEVEVVSLDWKWLFIYPEFGVATVNELAVPVGRTVHFSLTSQGVMNAFFVPQLGSQIYTMPGMQSQLFLRADHTGSYDGMSANYSGSGFADMRFTAKVLDAAGIKAWIAHAKAAAPLDIAAYRRLAKPGAHDVAYFGTVEDGLYERILNQCALGGICTAEAVSLAHIKGKMPKMPDCDPMTGKPIEKKS